jgi:hypothetical protein
MSKITLSAIVTGFPPGVHPPTPLPGETLAQLVVRNHPQEWLNCVERLEREFHIPKEVCSRLRRGEIAAAADPVTRREIERFMNLRLPSHGRTLQGLADLRKAMREDFLGQMWQLEFSEIIWPRQKNPSGNMETEKFAESLGVIVIGAEKAGPLDLGSLLKYVHGDYLWILPGGSRLRGTPLTMMALIHVLRAFQENPKLALYNDPPYCMIYRTAALRALMAAGKALSAELSENARMLQQAGFELAADDDPRSRIVEIEPLYGGAR